MTWDMSVLNISGTLNVFRVLAKPFLCLPHSTIANFNDLPIPLSKSFGKYGNVDIRAVVLDKDDCFAVPHSNEVYKPYTDTFTLLRKEYPGKRLLIVSNTAGAGSVDPTRKQAEALGQSTGVHVLQHNTKKPGCGDEIMQYFRRQPGLTDLQPSQVAVVGDRLMTDILMANMMGSWGVWVKEGVVGYEKKSMLAKFEHKCLSFLMRRGFAAPNPLSPFER